MMSENLVAACGLFCGWCPFYLVGSEEFKCGGCWSREKCAIRDCAKEKGLKICTYCKEFPCQKLYKMYGRMNEFFDEIKRTFPHGIKPPIK
ncbi:hypothetical protein DRO54_06035 [Candidatus Bathyarchaeota archaeon]|nr:MAG: hypothetical protein DRO54_06035 [Candidatus Bathyarchaeota archaeon]